MRHNLKPIMEIAADLGLRPEEIELYGPYKAKIRLDVLQRLPNPRAKYVLVTGTTPTAFGEGKTTVTIGLGQAFARLGLQAIVTVRQSSLGPVFGTKGAGAGGGAAQLLPFPDIALHFTGDGHAVTAAHNLCAAFIDNALYHGTTNLDPRTVNWPRVLDVNDRALRHIVVGLGEPQSIVRETRFDITAASEVMAILALASDYRDLRERLGRIVVGYTSDMRPVTAEDLRVAGPMAALLVDALKPNLVQTSEHTPALVHAGPFGNIAHGNSSVVADLIATRLADVVLTEAGFGTELGAEKFCHIKCRASGLVPDAAVLVTSVRSLKAQCERINHNSADLSREDLEALEVGLPNLAKHLENLQAFGLPTVVVVNRFPTDTPASWTESVELRLIGERSMPRLRPSTPMVARADLRPPRRCNGHWSNRVPFASCTSWIGPWSKRSKRWPAGCMGPVQCVSALRPSANLSCSTRRVTIGYRCAWPRHLARSAPIRGSWVDRKGLKSRCASYGSWRVRGSSPHCWVTFRPCPG